MYEDREALREHVDDLLPFQEGDVIVESPDHAVEVRDAWLEGDPDSNAESQVMWVSDGEGFTNQWVTASIKASLYPGINGNYALIRDGELVHEGRTSEGQAFGEEFLNW